MADIVGRWTVAKPKSHIIRMLFLGPLDFEGKRIPNMTRLAYFGMCLRGRWFRLKRWLRAPIRCKLGRHRIGDASDIGIGCVECGCKPGTLDVHCLDCDARLNVPLDDLTHLDGCVELLEYWKAIRDGYAQEDA